MKKLTISLLIILILTMSLMLTACHKNRPASPTKFSSTSVESTQTSTEPTETMGQSVSPSNVTSSNAGITNEPTNVNEQKNAGGQSSSSSKKTTGAATSLPINEEGVGVIHFGMTLAQMKAHFGTKNMDQDPNDPSMCSFSNDANNISYDVVRGVFDQIEFFAPGATTSKGLYIGDSYAKMVRLYGKNYRKQTEEGLTSYVYTYKLTEFWVQFGEGYNTIYRMDVYAR